MNSTKLKPITDGLPSRQGFYKVVCAGKDALATLIAEWRQYDRKQGKQWWHHTSEDPTAEKQPMLLEGVTHWGPADKAEVKDALRRELTVAERIEAAVRQHHNEVSLYPPYVVPIPDSRRLKVGDDLEIGALKGAEVVALCDDEQTVVFRYRDQRREYGVTIDCGIAYWARHWTEVMPLKVQRETALGDETRLYDAYRNSTLASLVHKVTHGLDSSPDYQRGYVWTADDKERYLASVFAGRDIGRFIFVKHLYPRLDDILDGKQRLNCLHDFMTSQFSYQGYFWHELSKRDRGLFGNRSVQYAELPSHRLDKAALLRIFLDVNAAGVPQSEEHLNHVRALLRKEEATVYLRCLPEGEKVAALYDEDERLRSALGELFADFEYPDFSYRTIGEVLRKLG